MKKDKLKIVGKQKVTQSPPEKGKKKTVAEMIASSGVAIDLACGEDKQPGFIGVDIRAVPGVDVVHDIEKFPYPFPDGCASVIMASHILEHINPHSPDSRTIHLIDLLLDKNIVTKEEVADYIGEYNPGPIFMRMMDEMWRILRVGGKVMATLPYAGSLGYWQDPTHVNGINEVTWCYFDPEDNFSGGRLYRLYNPRPWKVDYSTWADNGIIEVVLVKRADDPKYHPTGHQGFTK